MPGQWSHSRQVSPRSIDRLLESSGASGPLDQSRDATWASLGRHVGCIRDTALWVFCFVSKLGGTRRISAWSRVKVQVGAGTFPSSRRANRCFQTVELWSSPPVRSETEFSDPQFQYIPMETRMKPQALLCSGHGLGVFHSQVHVGHQNTRDAQEGHHEEHLLNP